MKECDYRTAQELWEQSDKELMAKVEKESMESEEFKELVIHLEKGKHNIPCL